MSKAQTFGSSQVIKYNNLKPYMLAYFVINGNTTLSSHSVHPQCFPILPLIKPLELFAWVDAGGLIYSGPSKFDHGFKVWSFLCGHNEILFCQLCRNLWRFYWNLQNLYGSKFLFVRPGHKWYSFTAALLKVMQHLVYPFHINFNIKQLSSKIYYMKKGWYIPGPTIKLIPWAILT